MRRRALSTSPEPRPTFSSTPPDELATRRPVDRVVFLMLENRSFDNIFGRYPSAEGTRTGMRWGEEVQLRHCPEWLPDDLPHDTASWHAMHNDGKMDGADSHNYTHDFDFDRKPRPPAPAPRAGDERLLGLAGNVSRVTGVARPEDRKIRYP